MGKIMKDGIQYGVGGVTDASDIKYGSTDVESALNDLNNGLPYLQEVTGTTTSAGLITLVVPFNKVVSVNVASVGNNWYVLTRKAGTGNAACFIFDNAFTAVINTSVTLAVWRLP